MKKQIIVFVAAIAAFAAQAVEIDLRTARITVENKENSTQARAAAELEKHLALIAGERKPAADGFEFVIGRVAPGKAAAKDWESHAAEAGGKIYFWGDDGDGVRARPGSSFAVYGFLEKALGVKWVRPGDDGIVFKPQTKVDVPDGWTYRFYPPLEKSDIRTGSCPKKRPDFSDFMFKKKFDLEVIPKEFMDEFTLPYMRPMYWDFRYWTWRMRLQTRAPYSYGHAFNKWNDRFYKSHREYMAMWNGTSRGHSKKENGKYVHLCYSNTGTQDQVIRDWLAAGTNEYLNICAADSRTTHCRCDGCRALDADAPGEDFLADKSDRQVWFWNRIAEKAMAIRPDVKLIVYIYANYRRPPRRWKIEHPDNLIAGVVPSVYDDSNTLIRGWKEKGLKTYFVRPNYLCYKGTVPRGLERYFFEDFKENMKLGMVGVDEDNFKRSFSMVVMFEFYALARVIADPTLTFDAVEREWLSQFGAAADVMKEYYGRVRERGEAARISVMKKGGIDRALDDSQLSRLMTFSGSDQASLSGDLAVIARALAVPGLSEAERRRVNEVRLVVEHAKLTQDFILKAPPEGVTDEFLAAAAKLKEFRISHAKDMHEAWTQLFSDKKLERPLWHRVKEAKVCSDQSPCRRSGGE